MSEGQGGAAASRKIVLVNFFNPKALAIRFLEGALTDAGYDISVLNIGNYLPHSVRESRSGKPGEAGVLQFLELLGEEPLWFGFSVFSNFHLSTVAEVSDLIRAHTKAPIVWGGIQASLAPERCLAHCDYVIRGEGETAAVDFSKRLSAGADLRDMPNLVYREGEETVVNPLRPFETDLTVKPARLDLPNKYYLDDAGLRQTDPCVDSHSYETSASRGCPYACTYCCATNIKRLYKNTAHYVRLRSVVDVIDELKDVKARMKKLSIIRFWDEVFSTDPEWVNEFAARYKAEIGLPFLIWTHPLKTDGAILRTLRGAGLRLVSTGFQNGSTEVRRNIYRRPETQEQILAAAKTLTECGVKWVNYDLLLGHPFETVEQLKESYELCVKLPGRFSLQVHGMVMLPGADIVEEAVKKGVYTREEMDEMLYSPTERQYTLFYEVRHANPEVDFWYKLIFMTQVPLMRGTIQRLAKDPEKNKSGRMVDFYYRFSKAIVSFRHIRQEGLNVILERRK
jgi:radical SAM superfamily enzyme YgiQ (UPF0313 family)